MLESFFWLLYGFRIGSDRLGSPQLQLPVARHSSQKGTRPPLGSLPTTNSANFRRRVLGCIKAEFCNQILVLIFSHFSSSTRFTNLRTAPHSKFSDFFCKFSEIFANFRRIFEILENLLKSVLFRRYFHGIFSELRKILENFLRSSIKIAEKY